MSMTLLQIRTQFAKNSGRYDLVDGAFADNGANYYIEAGQRMLDQMLDFPKDLGRYFEVLSAGTYYITFDNERTIDQVWMADSSDRWQLEYMDPDVFRTTYYEKYGDITTGTSTYWTREFIRGIPDDTAIDALTGYAEAFAGDGTQRNTSAILFLPAPNTEVHIEVWGKFKSKVWADDTKTDFWSYNHPDILINAALYKLEVSNRNRQGAADWFSEIQRAVSDIDKDITESDANQAPEMEG